LGEGTFCLRQDKCATAEAPFMYLLVGSAHALLIDSGDLEEDAELVAALRKLVPASCRLVIASTHPHRDHVAGNACLLRAFEGASVSSTETSCVFDLGGAGGEGEQGGPHRRRVEMIKAGRGHSDNDVCFLDSESRLLFTGDVLYPGYIYVRRFEAYRDGILSLWSQVRGRFDFSLGAHVEMRASGALYEPGARHQPDEMAVQQSPQVLELLAEEVRRTRFVNKHFALTPKASL
jgi:hydroxyacylglutathione hydrolase